MDKQTTTRVRVEPEHFIPLAKHRIVQSLKQLLPADQQAKFHDFCRLVEAIYHFEYHDTSQELKQDFLLFDEQDGKVERRLADPDQVKAAEDRFLVNFVHMMDKANFRLLTQEDIDLAEAEDYLFNLPVEIDWDALDTQLLGRYLEQHGYVENGSAPRFANRILMFCRGVGVDQAHGFHLLPKIDLLITRLLEWFIARIKGLFGRKQSANTPDAAHDAAPDPAPQTEADSADDQSRNCIHEDRYIERVTLRNSNIGLGSLLRRTRLQEPTFKELIILFRFASPTPKPKRKGKTKKNENATETEAERDLAIHIKAFREIPMADLEVVFPEKRISMKPVDLIKLIVTGSIGLVMVTVKFLFAAALNPVVALAALATVGGYAGKIFVGFKISKDRYQHLVTNSLYNKNLDNDLGVVFYLMDSLEEQELKEAVLAYFFLWTTGECTEEELDGHCEQFLHEQFGVEVDFEADDALEKLRRDNLITEIDGRFRANPLDDALRRLDEKWDNYFTYNQG